VRHTLPHRLAVAGALAVVALACAAAPAGASSPSPGAESLGDRLFPGLGNGGYDVLHYDLDLRYATSDPAQPIDGTATISARATQALSRFDLDFAGQGVSAVSVNGRAAGWTREGDELVVTPRRSLRNHKVFVVRVAHFAATPTEPDPEVASSEAFFITPDGSATAPQPDLAHLIYPSNDHPSDKASFTFRLDVPTGTDAFANGTLKGRRTRGDRTTWTYVERSPMATQLTQLAVGDYDTTSRGRHRGVPVLDVTTPRLTDFLEPKLATELGHLDWMEARVGHYPFDSYGSFVVDAELGFALETQTLSLYDRTWFTDAGQGLWDPTMLHELSHMWFGDSVSLSRWSDLWLSEGHASWYEFLYAEENGFLEEDTENYPNENGYADFDDLMRAVYVLGDQWRADFGPVARPLDADALFSFNAYHGGALVLYALRQKIGYAAFQRIEREWLRRYRDGSASTGQFIALASRVAHRDLTGFLRSWLYGTKTPPMPGHSDWTVDPVEQQARTLRSASPRARLR
jgi:aminopeptidase N